MYPFIRPGQLIEVQPLERSGPRRLDILLYRRPGGRLAAHRLMSVQHGLSGDRLVLRGDAPPYGEESVSSGQALGRVTAVENAAGRRVSLDSALMRTLAWLWVHTSPLSYVVLRVLVTCRNTLRRSLRFFGSLIHR